MSWLPKATARKVRAIARKGGHNMSRLNTGHQSAIASCMNDGCKVMVEITGYDEWRFIRLGEPGETCTPPK